MTRLLLVLILLFVGQATAETVYVNDMLRVGVRTQPASNERPISVVTTGQSLEVLERSSGYVKVRTEDGVEGWVNTVYVTDEKPARVVVDELRNRYERARKELERFRASATDNLEEVEMLRAVVEELRNENANMHEKMGRMYKEVSQEAKRDSWHLLYVVIGLLVVTILGIAVGYRWHSRKVSNRLGGLQL